MISLVNEFSAILDTCVLLPISLCDLLLRLAEDPALYKPRWSREILAELERNLQGEKFGLSAEKAGYRIACMESTFPEAMIQDYESLTESMPNERKDRHILAAAVFGRCDAIITANTQHFPEECLKRFGIERLTADEFLIHQWHLDQDLVLEKIESQVAACKVDMQRHLDLLGRMAPTFSALVRENIKT
jgi:predicted nucleic acid-binding protein